MWWPQPASRPIRSVIVRQVLLNACCTRQVSQLHCTGEKTEMLNTLPSVTWPGRGRGWDGDWMSLHPFAMWSVWNVHCPWTGEFVERRHQLRGGCPFLRGLTPLHMSVVPSCLCRRSHFTEEPSAWRTRKRVGCWGQHCATVLSHWGH